MQNDIENNTKNTQKNTENNTEKSIPDLLLKTGQEFYWCGILFIKIFLTALFVLITLMLIIEITADYPGKLSDCLTLNSSSLLVDLLFFSSYIGFLFGIVGAVLYLLSLHYAGLGQIAQNTMPKTDTDTK